MIREINPYQETITVEYDEHRQVTYPYSLADELELAYAITVHKAQGSEYPAVVIPLLKVTRAKKCVTLVGSEAVFQEMIQNNQDQKRNTSLAERIREFQ